MPTLLSAFDSSLCSVIIFFVADPCSAVITTSHRCVQSLYVYRLMTLSLCPYTNSHFMTIFNRGHSFVSIPGGVLLHGTICTSVN